MNKQESKQLVEKHIQQQLASSERKELTRWLQESSDQELEERIGEVWNEYNTPPKRNEEAYKQISSHLQEILTTQTTKKISFGSQLLRIASVLLIALGIAGITHYITMQSTYNQMAQNETVINTREGERITLTLPDGTSVSLNSKSSFSYPASFGMGERNVKLSGEAYFEVTHNEQQPFVVQTPQVHIKVLGTTFNVNAYPENDFAETTLVEGKVQLFASNDYANTMILSPNQTGRFDLNTRKFNRNKADKKLVLGWKNGDLVFHSYTLPRILSELEKYYGISIHTKGKLPEERFTGAFHEESINEVIKNLQIHFQFTYNKTGNNVEIDFK